MIHTVKDFTVVNKAEIEVFLKGLYNQSSYSQSYGVFSSHLWMWELDCKETWASKNWCFYVVVLGKTLESHLDSKEIKSVNSKRNQSWIFIRMPDAEAEAPILWPPDVKNWLIGNDPDAGKDWEQEEGMTEDEMVGWHHRFNRCELEQSVRDSEGQGKSRSSWGCKRVRCNLVTKQQLCALCFLSC